MGQVIARNASAEVAEHYCRLITSGAETVAIGLWEPDAGSDAGNPQTTATRDGDDWIINGTKSMSLAMTSTATVIFARTDPDAKRGKGISAFLVDLDAPGVTLIAIADMGQAAVARGSVDFTDVRVPGNHLLGAEGTAFSQVMQGFDFSRALIGLQCTGSATRAIEDTWGYVREREAFDQPLSKFQGVSFPLAEAETKMAAARLLCLKRCGSATRVYLTLRRRQCANGGLHSSPITPSTSVFCSTVRTATNRTVTWRNASATSWACRSGTEPRRS